MNRTTTRCWGALTACLALSLAACGEAPAAAGDTAALPSGLDARGDTETDPAPGDVFAPAEADAHDGPERPDAADASEPSGDSAAGRDAADASPPADAPATVDTAEETANGDADEETAEPDGSDDTADASDAALAGDASDASAADVASDSDAAVAPHVIRGRFESGGPIHVCGQVVDWSAPDGPLLRARLDVCGDDMSALAATLAANLDAVAARGGRALLALGQGPFLPAGWLATCETYALSSGSFVGSLCVPWDPDYRTRLRSALVDTLGPAIGDHPALAGVYFTISTMTNGFEMHFRVPRSGLPTYPGDAAFRAAYREVFDAFATAFPVPIVFEGGHCLWLDPPGGAVEPVDCATPLDLYAYARDTYGKDRVGVAVWDCAERFWATPDAPEAGTRALLEQVALDGVSFGCQTVSSFTEGACHFTDPAVGDYGTAGSGPGACPASASFAPEAACVDTLGWFAGVAQAAEAGIVVQGTWAEIWTRDLAPSGVYQTSAACRAAIDRFAP